ncbi:MFS transporter [Paludibaculum fermentans]|uniref:MFS transporter n=1 Tax=Paludibaculum fermentans TaxID=1473598 RepID=UPI003EB7B7B6
MLLLLAVSVLINYMDRGNLGIAAPQLTKELGLRDSQMGFLLAAFFWTYALFQIVAGWLVDRYDVARVYALGFLVWSVATLAMGMVTGFAALVAFRLLLGIGESVAYPAYSKILSKGFKEEERGLANGIIDAATKFGPAVGVLLGGWMIGVYGWRWFFILTGGLSLAWLVPWLYYSPRDTTAGQQKQEGPGWLELVASRSAWATFIGLFCFNYNWYLLLTWLPSFLIRERHFSMGMMSIYNAFPLCVTAVCTITAGWISDRMIAKGAEVVPLRRNFMIAGLLLTAIMLPFATVPSHVLSMTFLVLAFCGLGLYTSNCWALSQNLAGAGASGKWTGLQNAVGNLGGVVAPVVTGYLVERTGTFLAAFLTSSGVLLAGVLIYIFMLQVPPKSRTLR